MDPTEPSGLFRLVAQTDAISRTVLAIMLLMSLATWYLVAAKALGVWLSRRRSARFLRTFWDTPSIGGLRARLEEHPPDEAFAHLAWHAIVARRMARDDLLRRAMRRAIDEDAARLESGLTVLASIGSTAPFVGLFGTVWGVYHALVNIGLSGQGTLDKVAGPVGEALIMTALGLAVAIPAVLAYNAFVRTNRLLLARLDAFAHDLYAALTADARPAEPGAAVPLKSGLREAA